MKTMFGPYVAELEFPSHEDVTKEIKSENQRFLETIAEDLGLYHK